MGEKDITEKILADYNDVFADIVNVLLFGGKTIVDEVLKLMSVLTQDERFEQAQANGNKGGLKICVKYLIGRKPEEKKEEYL
jgi:hypothetical protein